MSRTIALLNIYTSNQKIYGSAKKTKRNYDEKKNSTR